jgi:chromosome partitioning protein
MNIMVPTDENEELSFHEIILRQGELISDKLNLLRHEHYPPNASKGLRQF